MRQHHLHQLQGMEKMQNEVKICPPVSLSAMQKGLCVVTKIFFVNLGREDRQVENLGQYG